MRTCNQNAGLLEPFQSGEQDCFTGLSYKSADIVSLVLQMFIPEYAVVAELVDAQR